MSCQLPPVVFEIGDEGENDSVAISHLEDANGSWMLVTLDLPDTKNREERMYLFHLFQLRDGMYDEVFSSRFISDANDKSDATAWDWFDAYISSAHASPSAFLDSFKPEVY